MKNYVPVWVCVTTQKTVTFLLTCIMLIGSTAAFAQTAPHAPKRNTSPFVQQRQKKQELTPVPANKPKSSHSRNLKKGQQKPTPQQVIARIGKLQRIKQQKNAPSTKSRVVTTAPKEARNYTYSVTNGPGYTFGYDIFNNGKRIIHQGTIPALGGNKKFTSREDAEKVARLVAGKMQGGYHAGLTAQDVKSLNLAVK